jgi:8-oxo-dGTP pyrophosphatase MutT (NUDIX family)
MNDQGLPPPVDTAPPRPAASLVLLRDDPSGLRVLLLERPGEDRVLAGARVFPGGKLETGVLLAREVDETRAGHARALRREGMGFGEVLERLDVSLDPSLMQPWSRWVTPKVPSQMRRRFDTRFFVARLPEGQIAVHDPSEAVAADWIGPREAIERYWAGEIDMAAPQIMTLAHLSRFADVDAALADAAARVPPVIRPEPFETPTGRLLCYPGDARHPVAARAMPGPTRLLFEQGRFRPEHGGLDAWFE